jgi:pyruvate kinase
MRKRVGHKTKIVVTLGPSSEKEEILRKLFLEGVDVFRLNFSHGTSEEHCETITLIRKLEKELDLPVAIMQDLQGPKIRLGKIKNGEAVLKDGSYFTLTKETLDGDDKISSVTFPEVIDEVAVGHLIYIDDGRIKLRAKKKNDNSLLTEVLEGGAISDHKGLNFPNTYLTIPAITEKDKEDLKFGLENGVDLVALSFVKSSQDVVNLRKAMEGFGRVVPIVSKIEKWEAVKNLDSILDVTDAAMVARGDLGVEMPIEEIPLVQRSMISLCNSKGKPVITATQMLNSMIESPVPTRAEVNDISNAIFEGTDAVMLSNETAVGKFPVEAVQMMKKVILKTEKSELFRASLLRNGVSLQCGVPEAIAFSSREIAEAVGAKLIITATESGRMGNLVSKYRPDVLILALTSKEETFRYLKLRWGVLPLKTKPFSSVDEILSEAPKIALKEGLIDKGDLYVITAGFQTGVSGSTNLIKVDRI